MKLMRLPYRSPYLSDDFRAFDSLFAQTITPFQTLLSGASLNDTQIAANVIESDEQLVIRLELPGVKRNHIHVQFNKQKLSIKVTQSTEDDESKVSLARTFNVNHSVDADHISASLADGILTLILPKAEETKPRSITIN